MARTLALLLAVSLALGGLLASGGVRVEAHAQLERAEPPADSEFREAPTELALFFTQGLVPESSWVILRDGDGNDTELTVTYEEKAMRARLPAIEPGTYTVRWQTLSAEDDDFSQGSYVLTLLPPEKSPSDGGGPASVDASDGGGSVVYVLAVAALAVVAAGAVWLRLRRGS